MTDWTKTQPTDSLAPWRGEVGVRPVSANKRRHTIHSYFTTPPESPDGQWVLYFSSSAPNAGVGEICVAGRASGAEAVLAKGVTVEDAHRVACQQWISDGKRIVYHDFQRNKPVVMLVELDTQKKHAVAEGRLIGWSQSHANIIPLYGPHWSTDGFRDLELLNVETGERSVVLTAAAVRNEFPEWISKEFGSKRLSLFFPILSPDMNRVLFKVAAAAGGKIRSRNASVRKGLVCYDLKEERFLFLHERWGHPAWHPNSRGIINVPNVLINSDDGIARKIPDLPQLRGSHPSLSPNGSLFVTDSLERSVGGRARYWQVGVADVRGKSFVTVHNCGGNRGATSWRGCHPHPVFSPDGRRIYFNLNGPKWTQLHVAGHE